MKKFWTTFCAGALALGMGATSVVPASAMPQPIAPAAPSPAVGTAPDLQLVQLTQREERRLRRLQNRERRLDRRENRVERRIDRIERRGERRYYRGYRGYRYARPGYRYYDGYYFPGAAFIAGAVIGGSLAPRPRVVVRDYGSNHVDWCYSRYRSYRASDNTYQPNSGSRRQCNSPFG